MFWAESNITNDELRDLLETRAETHFDEYMASTDRFKMVAKFPPAFGLMGTTIGLMALLRSLGGKQSIDNIGPGMAVALITTLYGLAIANFILIPISENLAKLTKDDLLARRIVVEGLMLIQEGKPTRFVEEKLKSFLLTKERNKHVSR